MSVYTTQVKNICEQACGFPSHGFDDVNRVIQAAIPHVFSFDFPIFDEEYRNVLCTKILRHYYTREIGEETVGLWKLRLQTKLCEIMPYYNQLYLSERLKFDPFVNGDYTIAHSGSDSSDTRDNGTEDFTDTTVTTGENNAVRETGTVQQENASGQTASTDNETFEQDSSGNTTGKNTRAFDEQKNSTKNSQETSNSNTTGNKTIDSTTGVTTTTSTETDESTNDIKSEYDKYSDTPQGSIRNLELDQYLTNARMKNGQETSSKAAATEGSTQSDTNFNETDQETSEQTGTVTGEEHGEENAHVGETVDNVSNTTDRTSHEKNSTSGSESTTNRNMSEDQNEHTRSNNSASAVKEANRVTANTKNVQSTDEYVNQYTGKFPGDSFSKLLMEFRETFLNIDLQVINELGHLFMNIW